MSKEDFINHSISELAEILSQAEDVDDALQAEWLITEKVTDSNVHEIATLFLSEDRYCNVAALRIMSDCGRNLISNVYQYIDPLFERDALILNRFCVAIIGQYNNYHPAPNKRMAQYIDFSDEPIRRDIRVWLLWRPLEELKDFFASYEPFESETEQLIESIMAFRAKRISLDQLLELISTVDDIAFREFTRLSKIKVRHIQTLLRGG